jgi:hypothetical protein
VPLADSKLSVFMEYPTVSKEVLFSLDLYSFTFLVISVLIPSDIAQRY